MRSAIYTLFAAVLVLGISGPVIDSNAAELETAVFYVA